MDNGKSDGVQLILGLFSLLMGGLVLAAMAGWVPLAGQLLAPIWIVGSIGGIFLLLGLVLMIPQGMLPPLRAALGLGLLVLVALVCNWSGFAQDVAYSSSSSISLGPISLTNQNGGGARVVFAMAAIVVDIFLIYAVGRWLWSLVGHD